MAARKIWQKFGYVRAKVHICFASKCVAFRADFIAKKRGICLCLFTLPHVIKKYKPYIFKIQGTYFKISALYFCHVKCLTYKSY